MTTQVTLAALLADPEFQLGLQTAHEHFREAYGPAPLTEKEISDEICEELNEEELATVEAPALYQLGFVVGLIDKGLSYSHAR